MVKITVPTDKFKSAKGTVKGRLLMKSNVFAAVLMVIFGIMVFSLSTVYKAKFDNTLWIAFGCVMVPLAIIFVWGEVVQFIVRHRPCLAVYDDYMVVYCKLKHIEWAYYRIDFDEVKGYGFDARLIDSEAKAPYFDSDFCNFGSLLVSLNNGKFLKVPIGDIATARGLLSTAIPVAETTLYRRV